MVVANPRRPVAGLIVDLDDTLVDTSMLAQFRERRDWRGAVAGCRASVIFPGVADMLQAVTARGIHWAVVTTSVSYYASAVLKHHGLTPNALVAFHDATPKPSPNSILLALSRIGVAASDAIGLGDADKDLHAYRAAGVRSVGAGWCPRIVRGAWDHEIDTPADLLPLLSRP